MRRLQGGSGVSGLNLTGHIDVIVEDKDGKLTDIVLGFDNVAKYEEDDSCMGGVIGRHANRIAQIAAIERGEL